MATSGAKNPADVTFETDLQRPTNVISRVEKEVAMRSILTNRLSRIAAAVAIAGTAVVATTGAEARDWRYHNHYYQNNNGAAAAAALSAFAGVMTSAAIASSYNQPRYYYGPPPVYYAPPPPAYGYYAPPPAYYYGPEPRYGLVYR
jgi:hypothetical protein